MTESRNETLEQISVSLGEELASLIPRMVSEEGSIHKAAVRLGVYPNSIRNWMKRNGYRIVTRRIAELEKVGQ